MNKKSSSRAVEFCKTVRATGRNVIVKVPGHSGRIYYVKIEWIADTYKLTCRRAKASGGKECPGNQISNSICYHSAAALEYFIKGALGAGRIQTLAWCNTEADAKRAANLINGKVKRVISTQGNGETWIVIRQPKVQDRAEICKDIARMCREGSERAMQNRKHRDNAPLVASNNSRTSIFK